jgi:hypothetical protein
MAKKSTAGLDALGWKFWGIAFGVLCPLLIYGSFQIVRDEQPVFVPIALGFIASGFCAAVVTWAANSLLQAVQSRRAVAAKRKHKK